MPGRCTSVSSTRTGRSWSIGTCRRAPIASSNSSSLTVTTSWWPLSACLLGTEPRRVYRQLRFLRGCRHGKTTPIFPKGQGNRFSKPVEYWLQLGNTPPVVSVHRRTGRLVSLSHVLRFRLQNVSMTGVDCRGLGRTARDNRSQDNSRFLRR